MICEVCNEEEAAFTMIPTGEGMPESIGVMCLARRGLEVAKAFLDPVEIMETLGPMFVRPPSPEEVANENPPAKPRARKSKAKAEAPQGEAGGEAETPPAAANE